MRSVFLIAAWFASSTAVNAAQVQVTINDVRGQGIDGVVVVATAVTTTSAAKSENVSAVMDQVGKHFVPEVLIVRVGTSVSFPNSDSVAHQVYSFSAAKRFALPLYRGRPYPPVLFDQPGIVVLGCNIHDQMVGYVYVAASPYFGKSDARGRVTLGSLPPGTYRVNVWHPRFDEQIPEQEFKLLETDSPQRTFTLQNALRPKPRSSDDRIRDY